MSDEKMMQAAYEEWRNNHLTMDGYAQYSPDDVWKAGCAWQASRTAQSAADNTPSDFQYGQWWVVELDTAAQAHGATDEFKRAVAVVHRLLRSISAQSEAKPVLAWLVDPGAGSAMDRAQTYKPTASQIADIVKRGGSVTPLISATPAPVAEPVDGLDDLLRDVERVMAKNIYPKPDAGPEHPWNVLGRLRKYRAALAQRGEKT